MIPKIIHYCWFGRGEKPKLAQKCIASWKKFFPDYEIIEWNEDNFDVNMNGYTQMCYEQKKYAFLSDYVRLVVISEYGGIYFDTDVEVIKPFDDLFACKAFLGFETDEFINTGLGFGAEAHNPVVSQMIKEYEPLLDGTHGVVGCPKLNTEALMKYGLRRNGKKQELQYATIFPMECFNPYDAPTGCLHKSVYTYSIHWYAASWMDKKQKLRGIISRPLHRMLGKNFIRKVKGL